MRFRLTIVSSLDTLWIMGLKDEFKKARDWVEKSLSFETENLVPFQETTNKVLGGLLSAYELSKDKIFLNKAEDLASRLLNAFGDGPIPVSTIKLKTGSLPSFHNGKSTLSEIGSVQLEFLYLAYHTGNANYAKKVHNFSCRFGVN